MHFLCNESTTCKMKQEVCLVPQVNREGIYISNDYEI